MKRAMVLIGWAVLAVIFIGADFYKRHSSFDMESAWKFSSVFGLYLVCCIAWYAFNFINSINEWERRPVLLFGKYVKTAGPGLTFIEPLIHNILPDVRINDTVLIIPVKEVQTRNNVGVGYEGVLTIRIPEAKVKDSILEVGDIMNAIMSRATSTLADETGKSVLDDLLEHRDRFSEQVKQVLAVRIGSWGPQVLAFEMRNFRINNEEIGQAIAMQARAEKEAQAELVRAKMQLQISEKLNEAAAALSEDGRWLKGIEVLVEMTRSASNNTILIPTDLTATLASVFPKTKGAAPASPSVQG